MSEQDLMLGEIHGIIKQWDEHGLPQCKVQALRLSRVEKKASWIVAGIWMGTLALASVGLSTVGGCQKEIINGSIAHGGEALRTHVGIPYGKTKE